MDSSNDSDSDSIPLTLTRRGNARGRGRGKGHGSALGSSNDSDSDNDAHHTCTRARGTCQERGRGHGRGRGRGRGRRRDRGGWNSSAASDSDSDISVDRNDDSKSETSCNASSDAFSQPTNTIPEMEEWGLKGGEEWNSGLCFLFLMASNLSQSCADSCPCCVCVGCEASDCIEDEGDLYCCYSCNVVMHVECAQRRAEHLVNGEFLCGVCYSEYEDKRPAEDE